MKAFVAFFKKEFLGSLRGAKLWIVGGLFVLFGLMSPAIAKITPWLLEFLSDSLEGSGMNITVQAVTALDSWAQYFKNIPMVLIVFVFLYGNAFSSEYESGAVVLLLTKGLKRYKVVLAKIANMYLVWTVGYALCFGVTYLLTGLLWDNSIAVSLGASVLYWWLFGIFTISLTVFFATLFCSYGFVLLGVSGSMLVLYLLSLWQRIAGYIPTSLMNGAYIVYGLEEASTYIGACVIASASSVAAIVGSIVVFNRKEL